MTFASGLRSILRQDPDVIMVGEIRDSETAAVAIQAAQTGHRLLSTVHTNDAAGAIARFIDMGIEPFLISSVLLVSFAQRLVRTILALAQQGQSTRIARVAGKLKAAKPLEGQNAAVKQYTPRAAERLAGCGFRHGSARRETGGVEPLKFGESWGAKPCRSRAKPGSGREGVETRRAAPNPREGHGEGIVQTTNARVGRRRKPKW